VQRALGYVRESQGNYTGAADAYEQAIKLSPNLAYLYIALGRNYRVIATLRDASKYPKAVEAFNKAATIDPNYATAFDELGSTYYTFDDLTQAQKALEKAIALDPESWLAQFHLALTYYARRNYEDAAPTFKTAIGLMNTTFDADHYCVTSTSRACERAAEAYTRLGLAYYFMDDAQCASDAIPAFQRALVVRPGNSGAQEGLRLCGEALKTSTPGPKSK
jgi:tetratricopeptide (TPR) repeat protein